MSNAMSLSKSRWKGALLATVAASVLTPVLADAQTAPTMTVSLSLTQLTTANPTPGADYKYIAPDATVPIYVYATITESTPITASNVVGLQYLYFNVNAFAPFGNPLGSFTTPTAAPLFNGGFYNASQGTGTNGEQPGTPVAGPYNSSTPTLALGSNSVLTNIAKPRSASAVFSTTSSSGIIINGNSASFLVETLNYTPSFTPGTAAPGGSGDQVTFNVVVPTLPTANNYAGSNFFGNLSSSVIGSVGASYTFTSYNASSAGVTLVDAEAGDANLDGLVNSIDFGIVNKNYGLQNGTDAGWTNGDLNTDGLVNSIDFGIVNKNYGVQYGPAAGFGAGGIAGPTALIGGSSVPEPTAIALLGIGSVALMGRRRRSI